MSFGKNSHSAQVGLIERYLGTAYDDILWLKANMDEIRGLAIDLTEVGNALQIMRDAQDSVDNKVAEVTALAAALENMAKVAQPMASLYDVVGLQGNSGDSFILNEYYPGFGTGGGLFTYQADAPKSLHDGGRYISSTVPTDGTHHDYLHKVGETDVGGTGIWTRMDVGALLPEFFGAHASMPADVPFQHCIHICRTEGKSLVGFHNYTFGSTVDVRDINIYLLGNVHSIHGETGIVIGTLGDSLTNPKQVFNSFTSIATTLTLDNPAVLVKGAYNQEISIQACTGIMVKSLDNQPVAHCIFDFRDIGVIYLYSQGNEETSFIENNHFKIGTVDKLVLQGDHDRVCNNTFRDAYMASMGEITLYRGTNNKFEGFHYNPYNVKIIFGQYARFNQILCSYICEKSFVVYPYLEISDYGVGNTVFSPSRAILENRTIASVTLNDVRLDTSVVQNNRVGSGLRSLTGRQGGVEDLLFTDYIIANPNEAFSLNVFGHGDMKYGFTVMFFDINKRGLVPQKNWIDSMNINSKGTHRMNSVDGLPKASFAMTEAAKTDGVAFIRMSITSLPYSVGATGLSITHYASDIVAPVAEPFNAGVTGIPTKGFAPQGYRVHNISGHEEYTVSFSGRSHLISAVTVESVVGAVVGMQYIAVGDICGIALDNGKTHWSKVMAKVVGGVRLETGVPSTASMNNEVVFVRWVAR